MNKNSDAVFFYKTWKKFQALLVLNFIGLIKLKIKYGKRKCFFINFVWLKIYLKIIQIWGKATFFFRPI